MDMPPMDKCPVGRKGRHHLDVIIPGEDTGDITWSCRACGALRRAPANGGLYVSRLDDETAEAIKEWMER